MNAQAGARHGLGEIYLEEAGTPGGGAGASDRLSAVRDVEPETPYF